MKIPLKITVTAILAIIFINAPAVEKLKPDDKTPVAKIGLEENIVSEGLKIRLFKDATARPIQAMGITEKAKNDFGDTMEYYRIIDFWMHDQYVGCWGAKDGKLTIYKLRYNVPPFKNEIIIKDNYEIWRNNFNHEWNDNSVLEWIKFLTEDKIVDAPEQILKEIPAKCTVKRYHMKNVTDDLNSYLYYIVSSERPGERYLFYYELPKNSDSFKSEKAILQSMRSITFFPPKKTDEKSKQKVIGTAVKKKDFSVEYAANREKVIKSIQNLKNWWYLETENYIIESNIKNKKTISELQTNLEKCRIVYKKYYPQRNLSRAISVCKVFETREEYISCVGEKYKWSGGIWMSDKKELVISPALLGNVSEKREDMMDIVYHEAFHQYFFYATDETVSSAWFNEGNACYFQGINFKAADKVKIDLAYYHESLKKLASSGNLKVESLIKMDHLAFYEGKDVNYAFAWGLLFFLHKGAPLMKDKNKYSEIPLKYYDALLELKNFEKATQKAWADIDMNRFNRDFLEFWRNSTMVKRAEEYDPVEAREKAAIKTQLAPQSRNDNR
jgi:hypothetical protein